MQLMVDGLLTTYERGGKGRTIILLHGWGDRGAGLRSVQSELSKQFDTITIDLPGFGNTEAPPEAWGLDQYARFVAHVLDKLGVVDLYAALGHSNGGAIAVRGVASCALKPKKLVLLASAGVRGEGGGRLRALRFLACGGKALTWPLPDKARQALRRGAYRQIGSDLLVAEHLQETFKRVVGDDVRADAATITIPTLLIYGDKDQSTPVRFGQLLHERIKNSRLDVVPGAGHFVHLDQPGHVLKSITEFLQ